MSFKIYTKTGDAGETGLYGGQRVPKDHIRIDAYGTVDELNSHLGLLRAHIGECKSEELAALCAELLASVQSQLFTVGSQLATPDQTKLSVEPIGDGEVSRLEAAIDALEEPLPALTSFILPAGPAVVAQCHVCRTVTRRAERCVVTLSRVAEVDPKVIQYLNRLSDYFFTLSRALTHALGAKDVPWNPRQ